MATMVNRVYSNFRGVDFRGKEINLLRSPDALNVWKDYKETDSIRTRPSLRMWYMFDQKINGIYVYKGRVLIHAGNKLIESVKAGEGTIIHENVNDAPSCGFVYNDIFYFIDGQNYLQYNGIPEITVGGNGSVTYESFKEVVGYIPTTTIARKPEGGGTRYEDVNMLSVYRKNSFLGDGVSFSYYLDAINIDGGYVPEVTIYNNTVYYAVTRTGEDTKYLYTITEEKLNLTHWEIEKMEGNEVATVSGKKVYCYNPEMSLFCVVVVEDEIVPRDRYTVDFKEGKIVFKNLPPPAPLTDGQDNVIIKFRKDVDEHKDCIEKCTMVQIFDNRVFFSGNPEHPNMMWHCSLNDPSYIGDLDYYREGMDEATVKGMVAGNNALWVFREPSDANTTVFYHTPAIDEEYGKIYPSSHSSVTTGCVGKAVNFNDDIVFFSERGMEGISGDVTTEQIVAHRSSLVDRKMAAETEYKNMVLAELEGYLMVFIGNKVYLADSRAIFTNENHYEYEWFMWEFSEYNQVDCVLVNDGVLYIAADNYVYTLTGKNANVESYWVTALDKFNHPHKLKTTNKRGCVVEATGDISVYAKLEDTDFELIGDYENVTDYFVSRIKRKKFKDIQLKFHSDTRFSLESVTLEAFIGGYIKR